MANDYARHLSTGRNAAAPFVSQALATLTGDATTNFVLCDLANATICPALEAGQPSLIAIWNSQSQAKGAFPIRLPVGFPSGESRFIYCDCYSS